MKEKCIYLDNQATTPVDPRVLESMLPFFTKRFGNPHSDSHSFGWDASDAVEQSRYSVGNLIGADAREIVFTSGATESCNIALRGVARKKLKDRKKIVTVATEHTCVLETCEDLKSEGFEIIILPVQEDGLIDLDTIRASVDEQTLLVSVMLANNEVGVIQPIREISLICRETGAYLHTDATQAVGKIQIDVRSLGVDFLSLSAHKFYGPKGIGALYVCWNKSSALHPLTTGGGQEGGLRPGTVSVPLVVGLGEASNIATDELERDLKHTGKLAKQLLTMLRERVPKLRLFGHPSQRLPGNLNIGFPDISGDEVIARVGDRIAISTGSACSSVTAKSSHVIEALNMKASDEIINSSIRISIGRFNKEEEIQYATKILAEIVS